MSIDRRQHARDRERVKRLSELVVEDESAIDGQRRVYEITALSLKIGRPHRSSVGNGPRHEKPGRIVSKPQTRKRRKKR